MKPSNEWIKHAFPPHYPVVFLHAHPDDEAFLTAGLLNELSKIGRQCIVVFGAAAIVDTEAATKDRQEESKRATEIIGIKKILYLDYCDRRYISDDVQQLSGQDPLRVSKYLLSVLEKNDIDKPFVLVSYDKNGGYGHPDHRSIHKIGRVLQARNKNIVPILYEATLNRERVLTWLRSANNKMSDKQIPDLNYWSEEFGSSSSEIEYSFSLSGKQIDLKRRALAAHVSQIRKEEFPLSLSKKDFADFFDAEFLVLVAFKPEKFYEIEKKYRLQNTPPDLEKYKSVQIVQGYISHRNNHEERIRQKGGKYYYSTADKSGLISKGMEVKITKEKFEKLWPSTKERRIRKTRYIIPYKKLTIELDVYHDELDGLVTAEVEFDSKEVALDFMAPKWLGMDVTEDKRYKNLHLAITGMPS